jgi:hypothetical protein
MEKQPDTIHCGNRIPLLTYYSPSHQPFFDKYFYPSYLAHLSKDFELLILKGEQLCNATFRQGNWNQQVKEKIIFVNNFIQSTSHTCFLFSDVDIIFYKNIKDELLRETGESDLVLQSDSVPWQTFNFCTGFYFCQVNDRTRKFFQNLVAGYNDQLCDQQNINLHLSRNGDLQYKALSRQFYNFSHSPMIFWQPGQEIPYPEFPIVMYHANFTMGNANKEFLLDAFKDWDNSLLMGLSTS